MDATERFPFDDNTFDYIFTEHMIEHINYQQGRFMLKECYRVLRPGGKIRVVTPDLRFLIELYTEHKTDIQEKYLAFSRRYFPSDTTINDTLVINNFFRDWGHQFIYDEKTLKHVCVEMGFQSIAFQKLYESDDINFRNLEKHGLEIGEEFNRLESLIIEGVKP
jgi:predicted SAM-dependent methyltransferase